MHTPSRIPLHLQVRRCERPLLPDQDIEVIVRGVQPRMSLRAEGSTEDDEILGDAGVDDIHRTHGAPGVVEHPFGGVGVQSDLGGGVGGGEVLDDVVRHERGVVGFGGVGDGGLGQLVKVGRVKDVPPVL